MKCSLLISLSIIGSVIICQAELLKNDRKDLGETLVFASVLYRHGDRTPVLPTVNDPHRNESDWIVPFGQLTPLGMRQHLMLGRWLRTRYKDFLPDYFSIYDIYIRSSDYERTIMSAEANLAGLYPPKDHQIWDDAIKWMPIPIHTVPIQADTFLAGKFDCPRHKYELEKILNTSYFVELHRNNSELFEYLTNQTGQEISNLDHIHSIYDDFNIELIHNKTLPDWTKNVFPDKLAPLARLFYQLDVYNNILTRLKIGPLIGDIVNNMVKKANGTLLPDRKMFIYSGHDSTVTSFLSGLKVFESQFVPYAATVMVELKKNSKDEYFVTVLFKNSTADPYTLTLPGCKESCPLKDFVNLTKDLIPEDLIKECSMDTTQTDAVSHPNAILIGALTVSLVFMLMALICMYKKNKRNNIFTL